MTEYVTAWVIPKKDYKNEGYAITTKSQLPDIIIISFPDGEEFDDMWREKYPTGWKMRLERKFALTNE